VDIFVVARTDARAAVSLHEAIARAQAALEIGVDAIFVEAPQSIEELRAVADATPGAVRVANMVEGGRTPLLNPAELHDLGYDLIVTPLTALFSATRAIQEAFAILAREGTMRAHRDRLIDFADFGTVVDLPSHSALERRYAADPSAPAS
jgi:methylisocitrate lyase